MAPPQAIDTELNGVGMETMKITSVILSAILSASATAEPPQTSSDVASFDPGSIIWETKWPGCWREDNCLVDDISFSEAYPKAFYKTDKFTYAVIGASMVATAVVTVATAGPGAPPVIAGTSWLIVLIGGSGQGAYMAGLSTIGSIIGSNAVGGAAILNAFGAAVGIPALTKTAAFGGLALKTMLGVSAAAYDGILVGENESTKELVFATELRLPTKVGSQWVQDLVTSTYENEERAVNALREGQLGDFNRYLDYQKADLNRGIFALKSCLDPKQDCSEQKLTRDDLVTISIMAYKAGEFDLFHKTVEFVMQQTRDTDYSRSFLNYLYATSLMMQSNFADVTNVLRDAIDEERNAIEPALLYIVFLAHTGFSANEAEIESRIRTLLRKFDDDDYDTTYSLATVYYRLGTIYAVNGRFPLAIQSFEKARTQLNFTQKWPIFSNLMNQQFRQDIELAIANSYFSSGKETKAAELFAELYESEPDGHRQNVLREGYVGSAKLQNGDSQ